MLKEKAAPVSYTHLDVYKRQLLLCAGYLLNGVHFHILTTRFPHLNAADLLWGYLLQYYVNLSKKARGIFLFFLFHSHFILLSPLIFSKKVDILYAFSPFRPFFRTFCTISTFCPVFLPSGCLLYTSTSASILS